MSLMKLRTAPFILIEDDIRTNTLALLLELLQTDKGTLNIFCYEQPQSIWKHLFRDRKAFCHNYYQPKQYSEYTSPNSTILIDSIHQMSLTLGWRETLKHLLSLKRDSNVSQVIIILHRDCLLHSSKLQTYLNHIASAIISYSPDDVSKISVKLKKSGKITKSEERLTYDSKTCTLKSIPIVKEDKEVAVEPQKPSPGNLSTFKIEVEQTDKIEKNKLQLPYMSKINEGGKVFYEPDAVDDWDDEDPDDDLDI